VADAPHDAAAEAAEAQRLGTLTEREHALFRLLAQGHAIADCARALSLSAKTASNYQSLIRDKLGVTSNAQLVHLALRHGVVVAPDEALAGPTLGTSPRGGSGNLP
jgi:DNA-binding NarL/FixJ family response regulator